MSFSTISANAINGAVCSTSVTDITNGVNYKVVTPDLLRKAFLALPSAIGGSSATFSGLVSAGSLGGAAVTTTKITNFAVADSAVTPASLGLTLASPPAIGATTANSGRFSSLTITTSFSF